AARGEHQHRVLEARVAHDAQHEIAVHAGEREVEDDEVRLPLEDALHAARAVLGHADVVALDLEVVAQAEGEVGIVLDDQDAALHAACPSSGSSMTKRAPLPDSGVSTHARPPWPRTSSQTTERPMPLPATAELT